MSQRDHDIIKTTAGGLAVTVRNLGRVDYQATYKEMFDYTAERDADSEDLIWLLEHDPVYTQGTSCEQETFLPSDIPVVKADRGGQITYHGPGQIVMYPLINLKRHGIGVKKLVNALEQAVINVLLEYDIQAARRDDAPGVYVQGEKIAALGLRIRRACTYHGLSFNINMDMAPFKNIDPCGFQGLRVTQLSDLVEGEEITADYVYTIGENIAEHFLRLI